MKESLHSELEKSDTKSKTSNYKKTFEVGEQRKRGYNWGFNPQQHVFGKKKIVGIGGVSGCLSHTETSLKDTSSRLGRKNGFKAKDNDIFNTLDRAPQIDKNNGVKKARVNNRPTDQGKALYQMDSPTNIKGKALDIDFKNISDLNEPNRKPEEVEDVKVGQDDYLIQRTRNEIKDILSSIGLRFKVSKFDTLWSKAKTYESDYNEKPFKQTISLMSMMNAIKSMEEFN